MRRLYDDQLIVVTGGAGFIGSSVVKHLNDKGLTNIAVVDRLGKTEKWKNLVGKKVAEVVPVEEFWEWLDGRESEIEAFIHLGACSSTVEPDAGYLLSNNYRFSVKLAEYALTHQHRFIYASSAATYGDGNLGFKDDASTMDALRPLNMYGLSKQLFDQWLATRGVLNEVAGLKYFNVYGPNEYHKGRMASAIFHMVPNIQKEGKVNLFQSSESEKYADGGQMRDFIYVKDAAKMTCAFLENDAGGLFNIGTGKPATWNQLAKAVFKGLNLPEKIEYVPMPADLVGKYQNYTCADMERTIKAVGKEAVCTPFETAVVDYVQNYLVPGKTW